MRARGRLGRLELDEVVDPSKLHEVTNDLHCATTASWSAESSHHALNMRRTRSRERAPTAGPHSPAMAAVAWQGSNSLRLQLSTATTPLSVTNVRHNLVDGPATAT
jgi:hypothetical protein